MNNSPVSSQLQRHRLSFSRGLRVLASIGLVGLLSSSQAALTTPERSAAHAYQLPLTFEVNEGQTDDRVDFLARGPGYNIFLTATEAVFALPQAPAMRMQLVGSAADPRVQGVDALPGKVNYFRGQDTASWKTKVPIYRRVKYSAVYPGVDLVYYGRGQQLEYDLRRSLNRRRTWFRSVLLGENEWPLPSTRTCAAAATRSLTSSNDVGRWNRAGEMITLPASSG